MPASHLHRSLLLIIALLLAQCTQPQPPSNQPPPRSPTELARHLQSRVVLLAALKDSEAQDFLRNPNARSFVGRSISSATPITADGYLLTAHHALKRDADQTIIALHPGENAIRKGPVTIIWEDPAQDLALIKAPFDTPRYYDWLPLSGTLPAGTPLVHGGIMTGPSGDLGQLTRPVTSGRLRRSQLISHSLPLKPGDSGGPLVTLDGRLLAIHHAIRFEGILNTQFFIGAESIRPSPGQITRLIAQHRRTSSP
jgi:S1-C subfamily serine protease